MNNEVNEQRTLGNLEVGQVFEYKNELFLFDDCSSGGGNTYDVPSLRTGLTHGIHRSEVVGVLSDDCDLVKEMRAYRCLWLY